MSARGFVWLVGAGPGDPDLLTLKAARVLGEADLVLHDALVTPAVLGLCHRHARRFPVGKRAGRASLEQAEIERLMVRAARAGRKVVRLKGGDPFVYGRGGEEALALAAAGVPFEVVPGISSALGAPALLGIPVTHRGTASSFVVVSGHAPSGWSTVLSSLAPGSATVVVLMGLRTRAAIASALVDRGWPRATPAAVLLAAGTPESRSWIGTLDGLGAASLPTAGSPGTIVVGAVVDLASPIGRRLTPEPAAAHGGP